MADKDSLIQYVAQQLGPEQLQRMVDQVEQELSQDPDVVNDGAEGLQELINQLSFVAENPESYKEVVTAAIQAGMIDPQDVPPEFDPMFVAVMILALEGLKARMTARQGFARGGLATAAKQLAAKGRGGDTMLAHINPREAEVLRRMGGAGTVNPHTGLHEFKGGIFKSIGKVFKKIAPIAISFIPGIGPVAGAALGATMGAMDGGGLKGAVLGGLGGYLGTSAGGGLSSTIGNKLTGSLGSIGQKLANTLGAQTIGSAVLGGASAGLMGKDPITGALLGGATSYFTPQISAGLDKAGLGNYASGITSGANLAAQTGGNPLIGGVVGGIGQAASNLLNPNTNIGTVNADASPYDPYSSEALANAGQSKLGGMQPIGADDAANFMGMKTPAPDFSGTSAPGNYGFTVGADDLAAAAGKLPTAAGTGAGAGAGAAAGASGGGEGLFGTGITGTQAAVGLAGLSLLGGMSVPQAQNAIENSGLTPEQKAVMNRELVNYTANLNVTTLPEQGTPEYTELMNRIQRGIGVTFMNPTITAPGQEMPGTAMARGGALSKVAMLARGTGHGRSDTINARLSDGEYVIDAETVALLGNGSTKAGASALDQMREQLRKQKGKVLAKGKFSPDAKSPLAYMKGGMK